MLVLLNDTLQQNRFGIIVFQKLFHFLAQIFRTSAPQSVDTHRVGEFDKVWVGHARVRVALFVEQV